MAAYGEAGEGDVGGGDAELGGGGLVSVFREWRCEYKV